MGSPFEHIFCFCFFFLLAPRRQSRKGLAGTSEARVIGAEQDEEEERLVCSLPLPPSLSDPSFNRCSLMRFLSMLSSAAALDIESHCRRNPFRPSFVVAKNHLNISSISGCSGAIEIAIISRHNHRHCASIIAAHKELAFANIRHHFHSRKQRTPVSH